jgi:hypothetical protein
VSRPLLLLAAAAAAALVPPVWAERPNETPAQLKKLATHVLAGRVMAVYERTSTSGDGKYTQYVAEVRVEECEKGDGVKKGDLVYVRYWRRTRVGTAGPDFSSSGHRDPPARGESVRVYLARTGPAGSRPGAADGGLDVLEPNGFERRKPVPAK